MSGFADSFLDWEIIQTYLPDLWSGLLTTLLLAVAVVVLGLFAGLVLAVVRALRIRPVTILIVLYADIFRALPPLVLLVLAFFGLPFFGLRLSGFTVSVIVLSGVLAAFTEELLWAGLTSIAAGQWEASRSTGLTFLDTMRWVVMPQAVRLVLGPLTSRLIATTKNTALASVVGVPELLARANEAQGYSGNASPLTAASLGYLLILLPVVVATRRFERRRR